MKEENCPYKITEMYYYENDKSFYAHVSLDPEEEYEICFIFTTDFIDNLFNKTPKDNIILEKNLVKKLHNILTENDNFLLIKLTEIALGDELIIESLKNIYDRTGEFIITLDKWESIIRQIKSDEETRLQEKKHYEKIYAILRKGKPGYISSK